MHHSGSKKLLNKVAIVTGASKGIGAGIALKCAAEGASVVVNYSSSREQAEQVVKQIEKEGGKAIAIKASLRNHEEIKHLFAETKKVYGKVDILVNNAGVYEIVPLEKITTEHFHRLFDLNVLGLILATQEAAKYFGPSGGSIVNISSIASTSSAANFSVYNATKAAVDAITRSLATELGPRKIRVNSINPGLVETEGTHEAGLIESEFRKEREQKTPLRRTGQPNDIAPAVVFLASDEASWITGEALFISGGYR